MRKNTGMVFGSGAPIGALGGLNRKLLHGPGLAFRLGFTYPLQPTFVAPPISRTLRPAT